PARPPAARRGAAVADMRRGAAPRLPLELALVKVTRPASDLSRESIAFRLERLEQGQVAGGPVPVSVTEPGPEGPGAEPEPERLEQGQASSGPVPVSVTEPGPERPGAKPEPESEPEPKPVPVPV